MNPDQDSFGIQVRFNRIISVFQEELSREQREYIASLQSARPRRTYSRRSNTTRVRRTRVTNGTTRLKRKYERRKNSSRLPRRESTWNTKLYSIIDEDYRKNVTGWLNEYHEVWLSQWKNWSNLLIQEKIGKTFSRLHTSISSKNFTFRSNTYFYLVWDSLVIFQS